MPMTRLAIHASGGTSSTIYPWPFYLSACELQARIALHHLERVWSFESCDAGRLVWYGSDIDHVSLWSDLQGAMVAAITLARLLRPGRVQDSSAKKQADDRGKHLRDLLDVPDDSPLLQVKKVRDAFEHIDERIDALVAKDEVASVSDCYVVRSLAPSSTRQMQSAAPAARWRHMNLRAFDPEMGLLSYDGNDVDLFAYEAAVCSLLVELPAAHKRVAAERPTGELMTGQVQLRQWPDGVIASRRDEIDKLRCEISQDDRMNWRHPEGTPGTVVFALDEPV